MTTAAQRIVLTGASGFLGRPLSWALRDAGYEVVILQRSPSGGERSWDPSSGRLDPQILSGARAVICLNGVSLVGEPWTMEYRWQIMRSRYEAVDTLVDAMAELDPQERPASFLCASAVGIYGADTAGETVDEAAPAGQGFLAEVCKRWEERAMRAATLGVRTLNIRTGLVLGKGGGMLAHLIPIYRLGLGARLGDGQSWMPVVSVNDWVRAVVWMIEHEQICGPVNVCCPRPVLNADFHRLLARRLKRPAMFVVPEMPLRKVAPTFAQEVIFASQRAIPRVLLDSGFTFEAPNALRIIQRELGS